MLYRVEVFITGPNRRIIADYIVYSTDQEKLNEQTFVTYKRTFMPENIRVETKEITIGDCPDGIYRVRNGQLYKE